MEAQRTAKRLSTGLKDADVNGVKDPHGKRREGTLLLKSRRMTTLILYSITTLSNARKDII